MSAIYPYLEKGFSLQTTGIILGLALIAAHVFALLRPAPVQAWLRAFPRDALLGRILISIAGVWCLILVYQMDFGEFENLRGPLKIITPALWIGAAVYMTEFLSVRALGILLLLVAAPILHSAFLKPPVSRLLIPVLVYVWILAGLFLVGKPYLLRDWIQKITANPSWWKPLCVGGIAYGAAMLGFALVEWGKY